jgi:hypothetical protein
VTRALVLAVVCLVLGCLTTPEARAPRANEASTWKGEFSRADWMSEFAPKRSGKFGLDNLSIESESGPFQRFLRAKYYKGGASPSASRRVGVKEGGGQFLGSLENGPVDHLFLRYYVRFPNDFDFVKGGKLPGLYGGTEISGGRIPDGTNGFSTRFMWRTGGQGEVYAYMPSSPKFGTSLGRGSWTFARGRWQCIEQELLLNTPGQLNGVVRAWLDGEPVYSNERLLIRTSPSLQIEGVFFSTFFGGGDESWAPPSDTYADFASFATGPKRVGCGDTPRAKEGATAQPTAAASSSPWTPRILTKGPGRRWGEEPIPDLTPTLDVTKFGAVPDDGKDDTDAFKKALATAQRTAERVVLRIPKGHFVISDILYIERGDFVLQGAGSGPDGTVLTMPRPLDEMQRPEVIRKIEAYNLANDKRVHGKLFSPFSWTGGIVWTRLRSEPTGEKLTLATKGLRGDRRLEVASAARLKPGTTVRINWYNRQGDDSPLLRHIFGLEGRKFGDRLSRADEPVAWQDVTVDAMDTSSTPSGPGQVVLREPLSHDARPEWQAEIVSVTRLAEVGIEHLAVEFPDVPYAGHHLERGFNAFYLTDLTHSWLRDVRIVNADSAVLTDTSSRITLDAVRITGRLGHYGIHFGSVDGALAKNFDIDAEQYHSVSFNTGSHGSVFSHGKAKRAKLDQHRGANHQNLFDDILDVEDQSAPKLFEHGGADYWGPTHGAFNTFWNVRLEFAGATGGGSPPVELGGIDGAGPARIVGLRANRPVHFDYPQAYVEGTSQPNIAVPSLYEYQLSARLSR